MFVLSLSWLKDRIYIYRLCAESRRPYCVPGLLLVAFPGQFNYRRGKLKDSDGIYNIYIYI
eukprot:COSAG06_NODE_2186_length_7388_cov_4.729867_3_plen_61_part_00